MREFYLPVLMFARELWPNETLVSDVGQLLDGIVLPTFINSFTTVTVKNIKYGASTDPRGRSLRYAFIDGRVPVRIEHILHLELDRPRLRSDVLIVRRFVPVLGEEPIMPWSLW